MHIEHVPYYRETMRRLGLGPADFETAGDLAKLPLIEREQLQRDPEYFVSRAEPLGSYIEFLTSGSTGEPIVFFRKAPSGFRRLGFERMEPTLARLSGRRWRRRDALILPPSTRDSDEVDDAPQVQWLGLHLRTVCRMFSLFDPPAEVAPRLEEFRPHLLLSYGSYVEELYTHLVSERRSFHRPKVVIYAADPISDPVRRLMREELGHRGAERLPGGGDGEDRVGVRAPMRPPPERRPVPGPHRGLRSPRGAGRRERPGGGLEPGQPGHGALELHARGPGQAAAGARADAAAPCRCSRTSRAAARTGCGRVPVARSTRRRCEASCARWREFAVIQLVQERPGHVRVVAVTAPEADREEIRSQVVGEARRLPDPIEAEVEFSETLPRTEGGKVRTFLLNG